MARKLLVANWKENPKTEREALRLFRAVVKGKRKNVEVVLCPPFIYLEEIHDAFKKMGEAPHLALGAQDVFWEEGGPYTSEVGPKMLRALGVRYAIVGHSDRRRWLKETDAMINKKVKRALRDGLTVILCVGEPLAVRKRGMSAVRKFVAGQLAKDLRNVPTAVLRRLVVAYEPIWAIGTGRYDNPKDASEMATFIKNSLIKTHRLRPRVLYGGSVNGKNTAHYVQYKSVDGALVGGASLNAQKFKKIIAAAKLKTNG